MVLPASTCPSVTFLFTHHAVASSHAPEYLPFGEDEISRPARTRRGLFRLVTTGEGKIETDGEDVTKTTLATEPIHRREHLRHESAAASEPAYRECRRQGWSLR